VVFLYSTPPTSLKDATSPKHCGISPNEAAVENANDAVTSKTSWPLEIYLNTPHHKSAYSAGQKPSDRNSALLGELDEHLKKYAGN
jgi:hypothetical protein